MRQRAVLIAIVALLLAPAMASSATLISTFGAGDTFGSPCYTVTGADSGIRQDEAFKFTVSGDHILASARIAIFQESGASDTVQLLVVEDAAGVPGTTVVDSALLPSPLPDSATILTATFSGAASLTDGSTYWLVVQATPAGTSLQSVISCSSNAAAPPGRAYRENLEAWQVFGADTTGAYSIEVADPKDSYRCYEAKDLHKPSFRRIRTTLSDIVATTRVTVTTLDSVCVPTSLDDSPISDPSAYLCCYDIKPTKLAPKQEFELETPFETSGASLKKAARVCVPCSVKPVP